VTRPRPLPPHPEIERRPRGGFGWLDAHLLHDGWLAELGADAVAVVVLLAVAADHRGASFYSRGRMAVALGCDRDRIDHALDRLVTAGLVALRPWRNGGVEGVWQLLPVPVARGSPRVERSMSIAEVLGRLGLAPK